ncbi:MAG: hypothetical protein ACRCWY_11295 [Cellulosilyticaceae bacterium]
MRQIKAILRWVKKNSIWLIVGCILHSQFLLIQKGLKEEITQVEAQLIQFQNEVAQREVIQQEVEALLATQKAYEAYLPAFQDETYVIEKLMHVVSGLDGQVLSLMKSTEDVLEVAEGVQVYPFVLSYRAKEEVGKAFVQTLCQLPTVQVATVEVYTEPDGMCYIRVQLKVYGAMSVV